MSMLEEKLGASFMAAAGEGSCGEKTVPLPEEAIFLRRMVKEDAIAVALIEAELFPDAWNAASLRGLTDSNCDAGFVCAGADGILAYCLVRQVLDEGEILRIGVRKRHQRRGLAEKLLWQVMTELSQVTQWNLEVREGNQPAIRLYDKMGFQPIGTRRNYYRDPTENAILMQCHRGEITNA